MPISTLAAARMLRRLEPDVIEAGDPYQLAWAAVRVKEKAQTPIVAFYHSDLLHFSAQKGGLTGERMAARYAASLYKHFDLVLAPSKITADKLRSIGVENVLHQPLGVDTGVFSPKRKDAGLRARLGLAPDTRLLIYAGRFTAAKKLAVLMDAIELLGPPYHLLMVGSGDQIRLSPRVTCLPFQKHPKELAGLMASCDALVHPGDQETFGLVVLEAMACGIPVVGTSAGGVGELVCKDTGLLVKPGSAVSLAEGVAAIYEHDHRVLGANGRRKVTENFDWNIIVPRLMAHYMQLLDARQNMELAEASYAIE